MGTLHKDADKAYEEVTAAVLPILESGMPTLAVLEAISMLLGRSAALAARSTDEDAGEKIVRSMCSLVDAAFKIETRHRMDRERIN